MSTFADVDALVRPIISATDPIGGANRYPESELRRWMGTTMLTLWRNRQDLWVGQYGAPPVANPALTDNFPLPDEYLQPVADMVIALSQSKDDEHVNEGRAQAFAAKFGAVSPL